jgi:endogenous inhibitor of DNA gyrase (YacG/DUF329 family)
MAGRCPVCKRPLGPEPDPRSRPFCSPRCKLVDLGRWLGESYRIPGPRAGDGAPVPPGEGEEEP